MTVTAPAAATKDKKSFLRPLSVAVTYAILAHLLLKGKMPTSPGQTSPSAASHDFSAMASKSRAVIKIDKDHPTAAKSSYRGNGTRSMHPPTMVS